MLINKYTAGSTLREVHCGKYTAGSTREKVFLFLAACFLFMSCRAAVYFSGTLPVSSTLLMSGLLFSVMAVLNETFGRRKVFRSGAVRSFFAGIWAWILWCLFGCAASGSAAAFMELSQLAAFTLMIFIMAKAVTAWHLRKQFLRIYLVAYGALLLSCFILRFDGFGFISGISGILVSEGRYRYSYGLGSVNSSGRYCLWWLIYFAIYRAVIIEEGGGRRKSDMFTALFSLSSLVVVLILLSSASRASITSLLVFWLSYFFLTKYQNLSPMGKLALMAVTVLAGASVIAIVDWEYVYAQSNRDVNYVVIPRLLKGASWLTGIGTIPGKTSVDSFYVMTLLQTGIIGCVMFFLPVLFLAARYFRDIRSMTTVQRMTGCLLVTMLYYALFEHMFFRHGEADMINWTLILSCLDEIAAKPREIQPSHVA